MLARRFYNPATDLRTETVSVALDLRTKVALQNAAADTGRSVSGVVREAIRAAIVPSHRRGRA